MGFMERGTTPTHRFVGETDLTGASVLYLSYAQDGKILLEKTIDDVDISYENGECVVKVRLTQKETLLFDEHRMVMIQIRVAFPDGTALASNIIKTSTTSLLKEGEI